MFSEISMKPDRHKCQALGTLRVQYLYIQQVVGNTDDASFERVAYRFRKSSGV